MASYFMNNLPSNTDKNMLYSILIEFADTCWIGDIRDDRRNAGKKSTLVNFENLSEDALRRYCTDERIILIPRDHHQNTSREIVNEIQSPSYYFYRDSKFGKDIEDKYRFTDGSHEELFRIDGLKLHETFKLTTTYPGLFIGGGYNHPSAGLDEDYQLGFFFDHTTGLPIISGSSIKGVAHSLFENDEKFEYLKDLIVSIGKDRDCIEMIKLISKERDENKKKYGNYLLKTVLEKRLFENGTTIYYDAYITETDICNEKKIFGSDYITSHHSDKEFGQFMEPNPVKFLKILSGVTFRFQFKAKESDVVLIKQVVLEFGLGAKTNVGYGQFEE